MANSANSSVSYVRTEMLPEQARLSRKQAW